MTLTAEEAREIVDRIEAVFVELTAIKGLSLDAVAGEMMARGYGAIFRQDIVTAREHMISVIRAGGMAVARVNRAERRAQKRPKH